MRVWFDLLTPKQILFFKPIINILRKERNELLITSRRYREVEALAKLVHLESSFVGERGGKDLLDQLRSSLERMQMLIPMVRDFKPGVAVSVASTDCARVSFGIRIKHIAVNDSPHSIVAAKLSIPFSHHLFTPWIIPFSAWTRFGIERRDITRYKALDPAAWLKREELDTSSSLDLDRSRPTIVVRLEETYASYMIGKNPLWTGKVLERLRRLEDANVVVLCRYKDQLDEIRAKFGNHFIVPDVVNGAALLRLSDVFIGMGGTMTTEAALIGIPTISMFQGEGLYTEKYLISKDLLMKTHNLDELARFVEKSLDPDYKKAIAKKARILLDSMEDPAKVIADYLMKLRISN